MAAQNDNHRYLEFFDVRKNECVVRTPITESGFIPRKGERIFISPNGPGSWMSYTGTEVEYFFCYDQFQPPSSSGNSDRITIYVEAKKGAI